MLRSGYNSKWRKRSQPSRPGSQLVRQPAVLNRFLPPLSRDPLILLADRTVMRKRAKRTITRHSLGAISRLEIDGRVHDVRSSGGSQKYECERFGE